MRDTRAKHFNLRMETELYNMVVTHANKNQISTADAVREILWKYVKENNIQAESSPAQTGTTKETA